MKKALSLLIAASFLLSMGTAQAWKKGKRYYAPRVSPYAYNYNYMNPYMTPYARVSPYGRYPQNYYRGQSFNSFNSFPMMGGLQSPWSQFGGRSFPSTFPMMGSSSFPISPMSATGFGSPFSAMSPMSPMGFGSPFSGMSPMGFGASPFSGMSPFGSSMPFNRSPFGNFGNSGRGGFMRF